VRRVWGIQIDDKEKEGGDGSTRNSASKEAGLRKGIGVVEGEQGGKTGFGALGGGEEKS